MRRAADKKDFADQKDATTLLSGMVCNCDRLPPPTLPPSSLSACLRAQERSRLWSVLNEVAASRCLAALQTQIKKHFLFFSAIRKYENSFCRRRWGRATMASAQRTSDNIWTDCSMWKPWRHINEIEADEKLKCIKML